jgi:hypothetical protein
MTRPAVHYVGSEVGGYRRWRSLEHAREENPAWHGCTHSFTRSVEPHLARPTRVCSCRRAGAKRCEERRLVEHRDAKRLRLFELGSGSRAGDHQVGLLRHRPGGLAAGTLDRRFGVFAAERFQRAGDHHGLTCERRVGGRRDRPVAVVDVEVDAELSQRREFALRGRLG